MIWAFDSKRISKLSGSGTMPWSSSILRIDSDDGIDECALWKTKVTSM